MSFIGFIVSFIIFLAIAVVRFLYIKSVSYIKSYLKRFSSYNNTRTYKNISTA